jgi:hypothetical protein
MSLTTQDYPTLTVKLNEWYNEAAADAVESWMGKDIFDVGETNWQVYNYLGLHGVAKFDRIAEGQQLPVATSVEGDSASFTQHRFGGRVGITKDMRMFDRYDQMEEVVKSNLDYAFDRIDQSQADMLLNGFSGSSFTDLYGFSQSNLAPDGVVTFSASHTNNINATTFRNLIRNTAGTSNPGLARDPIVKARADARIFRDPNGANRPVLLNTLIVSATNEDLAERTVYSSGVAGTPNVDLNPLKGKVSNIKVWSRLDTRSDGTDTSAYWFLADSRNVKKSLKSPFAQRPLMGPATQVHDSLTWEYPIDSYYTLGVGYPKNIFGSTGAN